MTKSGDRSSANKNLLSTRKSLRSWIVTAPNLMNILTQFENIAGLTQGHYIHNISPIHTNILMELGI